MQTEILSVNNIQWELQYNGNLSHEQRNKIVEQLRVQSLAPSCQTTIKMVGDTVNMSSNPTGGVSPYTYTFWKISPNQQVRTILQSSGINTLQYTLTANDEGSIVFGVTVNDSCPNGTKVAEEYCILNITQQCPSLVANLILQ